MRVDFKHRILLGFSYLFLLVSSVTFTHTRSLFPEAQARYPKPSARLRDHSKRRGFIDTRSDWSVPAWRGVKARYRAWFRPKPRCSVCSELQRQQAPLPQPRLALYHHYIIIKINRNHRCCISTAVCISAVIKKSFRTVEEPLHKQDLSLVIFIQCIMVMHVLSKPRFKKK